MTPVARGSSDHSHSRSARRRSDTVTSARRGAPSSSSTISTHPSSAAVPPGGANGSATPSGPPPAAPPPPPPPPLRVGDARRLVAWVHGTRDGAGVLFNKAHWPAGDAQGSLIRVTAVPAAMIEGEGAKGTDDGPGFLFVVPRDGEDGPVKAALQISIPKAIADTYGIMTNDEVLLTKVDTKDYQATYVEFSFGDQYLGRNDMWRLTEHLEGSCVHVGQEVTFIGAIAAKVMSIYVDGKSVSAGYVTSTTKATYRSLSAKVTIFIQVCRELWEFAGDGERYNERIVHSFLPTLFQKWRDAGTNHIVTIVLISRVYYDQSEVDYAAGPLRKDEDGSWYKDFYKVITDLEVIFDWRPTLVSLKDSFWAFQRDILLTHHYHRATVDAGHRPPDEARLIGQLSFAHDGPVLEAINLALNPMENHFVDRALSLTGSLTIIITPGTGHFRVNKHLLRLTTTRLLDQGFGVDLVSLTKPPLHQSPVFAFKGVEPDLLRAERDFRGGYRSADPLWGGDDRPDDAREKVTFWWEPFWMSISFWDRQMDLPFRPDRFVARAKMHQIQMLGLLDHDVLSGIEVPFLPDGREVGPTDSPILSNAPKPITQAEAEKFDLDTFTLRKEPRPGTISRNSFASSGSGTVIAQSWSDRRSIQNSHRNSVISTSSLRSIPPIEPIEESPYLTSIGLPGTSPQRPLLLKSDSDATVKLSTSPSQVSVRSTGSGRSASTIAAMKTKDEGSRSPTSSTKGLLKPLWFLNPFKNTPVKPETVPVTASATSSTTVASASTSVGVPIPSGSTPRQHAMVSRSPQPIRVSPRRSAISRARDEDTQGGRLRTSPINTPPRDEPIYGRRRGTTLSTLSLPFGSSPMSPTNPLRAHTTIPYAQYSLARRWQHVSPVPLYRHELKWKAMVSPSCLPLTVEHFPSVSELETSYGVFSYDFVVDPAEMHSFLVRPPVLSGSREDMRRTCAFAVMRGMAAVRLAQGFQFVLRPGELLEKEKGKTAVTRSASYASEDETTSFPAGIPEVRKRDTIYLSMTNEIHRIAYTGDTIQVRRYVRRVPQMRAYKYECLIWPKLGLGYTDMRTAFDSRGLEEYGWNRLDMLVAGYEHQFNESLKYWRTRFIVIPVDVPSTTNVAPPGESLNDEEIRLLGMDKLAEMFSKVRWQNSESWQNSLPPVRFLPTDLDPASCVQDETIVAQLEQIHAVGPLRKKIQERYIGEMSLHAIAKAMREDDAVTIKEHRWHGRRYPDSFTGWDFVSWLVREFTDISSREQGAEWGVQLQQKGLFSHSRGLHGFLDGHYYYQLRGEYAAPSTPKTGWFRQRHVSDDHGPGSAGGFASPRRTQKRLILSQSMVIDVDPSRRSDQAESAVLHHDIIHNPATAFHFELHWIGTTARCIEDLIYRQWSRTIERYGLRLVEAYVRQISDIHSEGRNAFQSCFPIRLALAPPSVPEKPRYMECAILRHHDFVLDIEAADTYPREVDVHYSYRAWKYTLSQYVHRSGVVFVQVVGGTEGYLFLTNRLMVPGRMGSGRRHGERNPAEAAEDIRIQLAEFCSDPTKLASFYKHEMEVVRANRPMNEPPPLSI